MSRSWLAVEYELHPLSDRQVLVHALRIGRTVILSEAEARLLAACAEPLDLEAHARRILAMSGGSPAAEPAIRKGLQSLVDQGLLQALDAVRAEVFGNPGDAEDSVGVTTIAVLTCGRPAILSRCLTGFFENARAFSRDVRFLIVDDSRELAAREANLTAVSAVAARGARILYADRASRGSFAERLAKRSGVPPSMVEWALLGEAGLAPPIGAARNCVLLGTIGELVLSLDDDMVCRLVPLPTDGNPSGLVLRGRGWRSGQWSLASAEQYRELEESAAAVDFLALHERLLGRRPAQLAEGGKPEEIQLFGLDPVSSRRFRAKDSRILLTSPGLFGDSGQGSTAGALFLKGQALDRLRAAPGGILAAVLTRRELRGPGCATISAFGPTMGGNLGMDHRLPLPPHFPGLRGEDDLFGDTVRYIASGGLLGFLPYALLHQPDNRGPISRETLWQQAFAEPALGMVAGFFPEGVPDPATAGELERRRDRLLRLGRAFRDAAEMERGAFAEKTLHMQVSRFASAIRLARDRLGSAAAGGDPEYRALLEEYVQHGLGKAAALVPGPDDLSGMTGVPIESFQKVLGKFGSLLETWPELSRSARELFGEGEGLFREIH